MSPVWRSALVLCVAVGCGPPIDPDGGALNDANVPMHDSGRVDSGVGVDAARVDGQVTDAIVTDGGVRPPLCSGMEAYPPPASPPCSTGVAACFRACTDWACGVQCAQSVTDAACAACIGRADYNCSLVACFDQVQAYDCCLHNQCGGSVPCEPCQTESSTLYSCQGSDDVWDDCALTREACFPDI